MLRSGSCELFWRPPHPFSNWTPSTFTVNNVTYTCAEQFMMAAKARLFGDLDSERKIMATSDPKQHKDLGRLVRGFDERVWNQHRVDIVVQALRAKFGQNSAFKEYLVGTESKTLVEASPFAPDNPKALDRKQWRGLNLLGEALMQVRSELK
ncbi:hypothetical protein BASA81_000718 [Batrachochytrium salamandrivorans]|nr:hypothetical protein BASA81_000718 [Batrachochytrium salamandrivorans]